LRRDAGQRRPALMAAEDRVEQVAELVEEGHDVVVLHEPRIALRSAGEVADETCLGELQACNAGPDVELRSVVELPGPRMEIEEEPAEKRLPVVNLIGLDARIPHVRMLDAPVGDAVELGRDVEHSLLHAFEGEVGAGRAGIEVGVALPDELLVVAYFPAVYRGR